MLQERRRFGPGRRPTTTTKLGQILNRTGMSVRDLADCLECSAATASNTLNGRRELTPRDRFLLERNWGLPSDLLDQL